MVIETCYYLDDFTNATPKGALFSNVRALSKSEMKKSDSFSAFDFDNIWKIGTEIHTYPVFKPLAEEDTKIMQNWVEKIICKTYKECETMSVAKNRVISFLLALCILTAILPANVHATDPYNPEAALAYAKKHWNDGKGLCAEFVSDCLNAGGCSAWNAGCTSLVRLLKSGGYGKLIQLNVDSRGRIPVSQNKGKVSPGDPIFCYCSHPNHGSFNYTHVYLCGYPNSSGYYMGYAHNDAYNGETGTILCLH